MSRHAWRWYHDDGAYLIQKGVADDVGMVWSQEDAEQIVRAVNGLRVTTNDEVADQPAGAADEGAESLRSASTSKKQKGEDQP